MLIDPHSKIAFISIPKTGSTSIMSFLNPSSLKYPPEIYHAYASECLNFDPTFLHNKDFSFSRSPFKFFKRKQHLDIENFTFVAIIREPLERLASLFYDIKLNNNHPTLSHLLVLKNFNDFLEYYLSHNVLDLPRHLMPQYFYIETSIKKKTKLFMFEDIKLCFNYLKYDYFFSKNTLPHLRKNTSGNMSCDYRDIYDDSKASIRRMKEILADDYILYNSLLKIRKNSFL